MKLPPDVLAAIRRDFDRSESEQVAERLARLAAEIERADARVLRCVLHLADGDFGRLVHYAGCAARDWRDVIYWAEYGSEDRQVRDFRSRPDGPST
jgi:hypothetical protein